jgi:hypothetical protein
VGRRGQALNREGDGYGGELQFAGERKLLPIENRSVRYQLHCLSGAGYLRVMSCAERQYIKPGDQAQIQGGEIATLTGTELMFIELRREWA